MIKFPLIMTRDDMFLEQYDLWNSKVAVVAYILEFYVHQFNSPFLLNKDEVDNNVYKLGQLWLQKNSSPLKCWQRKNYQ